MGDWTGRIGARGLRLERPGGEGIEFGRARVSVDGVSVQLAPGPASLEAGIVSTGPGPVVERHRAAGLAVEVTWTVAARPSDGLRFEIPVQGAEHRATDEAGVLLAGAAGRVRFGHGTWVDAAGRRTRVPAHFERGAIALEVPREVVDASRYPAVLDPIIYPEEEADEPLSMNEDGGESSIASDGSGFLVVWRSPEYGILGARLTASGDRPDQPALRIAGTGSRWLRAFFDGTDYLVVWVEGTKLRARRVSTSGAVLGSGPTDVLDLRVANSAPALAYGDGVLLVAWMAETSFVARRVSSSLQVIDEADIPITGRAAGTAAYAAGAFLVGAWDWTTDNRIIAARVPSTGAVTAAQVTTLGNGDRRPVVAARPTGFFMAWGVSGGPVPKVMLAVLEGSAPARLVSLTAPSYNVLGAVSVDGRYVVVASDSSSVKAALIDADLAVIAPFGELFKNSSSVGPAFGASSDVLLATYTAQDPGSHSIGLVGSRYDRALKPLDASPLSLGAVPNSETKPTIACTPSQCLVAWTDSRASDLTHSVYSLVALRTDLQGRSLEASATMLAQVAYGARVVTDGQDFLVVWNVPVAGPEYDDIYFSRVSSAGVILDPGGRLLRKGAALTDACWGNGAYVVLFNNQKLAVPRGEALRLDASGTVLDAAPVVVSSKEVEAITAGPGQFLIDRRRYGPDLQPLDTSDLSLPGSLTGRPSLAFDGHHYVHVQRDRISRISPAGAFVDQVRFDTWGGEGTLVFDGTYSTFFWQQSSTPVGLRFARFDPTGRLLDYGGRLLSAEASGKAAAASDGQGRIVVAYSRRATDFAVQRLRLRAMAQGAGGALGTWCALDADCLSGHCSDGVCCDSACGGGDPNDCQVCSAEAGAPADGTCGPRPIGTVCRASVGACDVEERCAGEAACPADRVRAAGTICRAGKPCLAAATCDGQGTTCLQGAAAPEGEPCDDGRACTTGEVCASGTCRGTAVPVPAVGPCEGAGCFEPDGVVRWSLPDGTACADANPCHGPGVCQAGLCIAPRVACEDGCTRLECGDAGPCAPVAEFDGTPCDDGDACTRQDSCRAGACVGADPVDCGVPGTCEQARRCDPATGTCYGLAFPYHHSCDDGDPCTGSSSCRGTTCAGGAPKACSAGSCRVDARCDPASGACVDAPAPDGTACDDGDACTVADRCVAGTCAGTLAGCSPVDGCHGKGACDPATGACSSPHLADGTPCANLCVAGAVCREGDCGAPVACPPTPCTLPATCDPADGECHRAPVPDGWPCDDGDACTSDERCAAGTCSGTRRACPPSGEACRLSVCDPLSGDCTRVDAPEGTACEDGDPCTLDDGCRAGSCVGTAIVCAAPDACHRAGSCVNGACSEPVVVEDGAACDDGDACTAEDRCAGGVCQGTPRTCVAPDACHGPGSCDPATGGCLAAPLPDGTACDDGLRCTSGDRCHAGRCEGMGLTCTPATECSISACDEASGACVEAPAAEGTPCPSGACRAGACTPEALGCGCGSSAGSAGAALPLLLALAFAARRRRAGPQARLS